MEGAQRGIVEASDPAGEREFCNLHQVFGGQSLRLRDRRLTPFTEQFAVKNGVDGAITNSKRGGLLKGAVP